MKKETKQVVLDNLRTQIDGLTYCYFHDEFEVTDERVLGYISCVGNFQSPRLIITNDYIFYLLDQVEITHFRVTIYEVYQNV